jgi:hypothetical protein
MDLFKFYYTSDMLLDQGEAIHGYKSVMWTERYADPGEFEIQAQLSTGLKDFLPLGSIISHMDTLEMMIVENHEITEKTEEDPTLVITGRSFESFLEHRIVGMSVARQSSTHLITDYILSPNVVSTQCNYLINQHINGSFDDNDDMNNVVGQVDVRNESQTKEERTISRGDVLSRLHELLAINDLGVKTVRRNSFGAPTLGNVLYTTIYTFNGIDRSATVHFSWREGDLESAEYLFTNKKLKNSVLITSRYMFSTYDAGPDKYDRRIMLVDASDLDDYLDTIPDLNARANILNKMEVRAKQALQNQQMVTIGRTDISKITQYQYRRDYNIGDLVSLDGNFGTIQKMRVVEYVEIEDENGESGHPTLAVPGV